MIRRSRRLTVTDVVVIAFVVLLMILISVPVFAAGRPVTFCDVCEGWMIGRKGDTVYIRCPEPAGKPADAPREPPWMTVTNCSNPIYKGTKDRVTITCNFQPN